MEADLQGCNADQLAVELEQRVAQLQLLERSIQEQQVRACTGRRALQGKAVQAGRRRSTEEAGHGGCVLAGWLRSCFPEETREMARSGYMKLSHTTQSAPPGHVLSCRPPHSRSKHARTRCELKPAPCSSGWTPASSPERPQRSSSRQHSSAKGRPAA